MAAQSSELVRITIPIPRELLDQLSVLAWRSDLTRPQLCRRYLANSAREGIRRYADLEGASPELWYAAAIKCWREDNRLAPDAGEAELTVIADRLHPAAGEGV